MSLEMFSIIDGKQKDPKVVIRGVEEFIDRENENLIEALKERKST